MEGKVLEYLHMEMVYVADVRKTMPQRPRATDVSWSWQVWSLARGNQGVCLAWVWADQESPQSSERRISGDDKHVIGCDALWHGTHSESTMQLPAKHPKIQTAWLRCGRTMHSLAENWHQQL
jgi:hypothetical protein